MMICKISNIKLELIKGVQKLRVNNFEHPGAVLASSHKINIENGCVQKNRQDKSLLDYYLEDERAEDIIPSFLYTKSGISQD